MYEGCRAGIYLGQWMEQVQHGQNVPMKYETADREEVILGFFYEEDHNQWNVFPAGKNLNFKSV